MATVCDTSSVPPSDRLELWAHATEELMGAFEISAPRDELLSGRIVATDVGPLKLVTVEASAQQARRTRRLITRGAADCYVVTRMRKGTVLIEQDARRDVHRPGDFVVYDCSRPCSAVCTDASDALTCVIPREHLGLSAERIARITGTTISGRRGVGWMLAPFLDRLAQEAERGELGGDVHRIVEGTLDLVASLCESRLGSPRRSASRTELVLRIRAYVDANLADGSLSPEMIARTHYISKSYLHKLFAQEATTVSRLIRERRLERCRRHLADPACADEPVSWIAARCGLTDPRYLSRLFREAYGCTPTEYRREHVEDALVANGVHSRAHVVLSAPHAPSVMPPRSPDRR